jgi:hypothetical protein
MMRRKETEFFLSLFMKKRKELLENALGFDLEKIELEKSNGRKKIDVTAVNAQRRLPVYIENQISPSDPRHLEEKVFEIIRGLQEGIVVWVCSKFNREHIAAVQSALIQSKRKYVNFYCIEVSMDLILHLESLNYIERLEIWSNLDSTKFTNQPFRLVHKYVQIPSTHIGKSQIERELDVNRIEDVQEILLEHLRSELPEFTNVHKGKKCNEGNRSISIGAGADGITYRISTRDMKNLAFVKLCYDANRIEQYKQFQTLFSRMKSEIHPDTIMGKRCIGVSFRPSTSLKDTIKQIATILRKMIRLFTPFIYGEKEIASNLLNTKNRSDGWKVGKVTDAEMSLDQREWLLMPGIEPWIAELLAEEVDNERALQINQERLIEYLA